MVMLYYISLRMVQGLIAVIGVSLIVFVAVRLTGDLERFLLPPDAAKEDVVRVRSEYGLDKPLPMQYGIFVRRALQGNFGASWRWHDPAFKVIVERLPATLQLASFAAVIALSIALVVGTLSAVYRGSWIDQFGKVFALCGQSMPSFWVGIVAILLFSVKLGWLPTSGRGGFDHLLMPAFTLGWAASAALTRITRSAMLDVLDAEYIKLARIKGLAEGWVIWKHALRNAAIPIITLMGIQWANLLSGSVIVETIFAWPGVGRTLVEAINNRDFAVVQAGTILLSVVYIGFNLAVDLAYGVIDPRIRYR
jgi:peptide/nickel transport system permease protein